MDGSAIHPISFEPAWWLGTHQVLIDIAPQGARRYRCLWASLASSCVVRLGETAMACGDASHGEGNSKK